MILSTLDVAHSANNREHHLISFIARRVDHVWVIYRSNHGTWRGGRVARLFLCRARVSHVDNVTYIAIDPPLNLGQGHLKDEKTLETSESVSFRGAGCLVGSWILGEAGTLKDICTIAAFVFFARRHGPRRVDVIAGLSPWGAAAGLLLKASGHAGAVFYEDRDYEPGFVTGSIRRRWTAWLERACIRRADGGLSIGSRLSDLRFEQTGRRLPVVTSGIDTRKAMCLPVPRPVPRLVYVGRVTTWNGLDVVVEAMGLLSEKQPDLRFCVVGKGTSRYCKHLLGLAKQVGVGGRVKLVGPRQHYEACRMLSRGGIGIATLRPIALRAYAFPLKVLDYMAAGLPIVGSENSETAEILARHNCGISPRLDASEIADVIQLLLENHALYQRLAVNGRNAVSLYDLDRVMEREYALLAACARSVPEVAIAGNP